MLGQLMEMFDGVGLSEALAASPLVALVTLFGAGLVTSLTPCVYPMIPITASVLAATAVTMAGGAGTVGLQMPSNFSSGTIILINDLVDQPSRMNCPAR